MVQDDAKWCKSVQVGAGKLEDTSTSITYEN